MRETHETNETILVAQSLGTLPRDIVTSGAEWMAIPQFSEAGHARGLNLRTHGTCD